MTGRCILWWLCFLLTAAACIAIGQLPALDADVTLRVLLYLTVFLLHIGLIFLWPFQKHQTYWLIATAIILRVCLIPAPVSDDVHRYLWEGKLVTQGINPYATTADDPTLIPQRDAHWEFMNHRDKLTAYPPGIQLIFAGLSSIYYHPLTFKIAFVLADLLALFLLTKLLGARGQPLRLAGFYAFSPLVLMAIAAEAHYDSFFVLGLISFWLSAELKKPWLAWLSLAFAAHIKIICILLAPLYFNKHSWKSSWIFPLIIALLSLPFISEMENLIKGLLYFADKSQTNDFIHGGIAWLSSVEIAGKITTLTFAALGLFIWFRTLRGLPIIQASLWVLGGLILFSPVIHFWYLIWIAPLFCLRSSLSWLVLTGTIGLYFFTWQNAPWGLLPWQHLLIWLPFALVGILELPRAIGRLFHSEHHSIPSKSSVIIPTLNAEASLTKAIHSAKDADEIVIIDGGSTDETLNLATQEGASIHTSPPGRGAQIAKGISMSHNDLIIILHADAILPDEAIPRAMKYFTSHPNATHCVLGQRFDQAGPLGLLVEVLNEMRVVLNGTSFGDQVQIFRRSALEKAGGFPTQPLMEDVEAALRTLPLSMTGYLGKECTVSGEKWRQGSSNKRFAMVIQLVATYRLTRLRSKEKAAQLTERLYKKYYG